MSSLSRKKEKKNIRNSTPKKKERKKNCRGIAWAVEFSKGSIDDDVDHETGQDGRIHEGDAYRPYVNTEKGR